jgi:pyruvate dehydrogenase E2 component (dihydrolipoamide acetyltransferase)
MAKTFRFPDVGEGITEGEIVRWLVAEGDVVKTDQTLAEIETDKAVVEMPSPYAGTVLKLHAKEKDIVKVGSALVTIGEKGESVETAAAAAPERPAPEPPEQAAPPPDAAPRPAGEASATPKVRKMAGDMGLDLSRISGTGPAGRITEADLKAAAEGAEAAPAAPAVKIKAKFDFYGELERVPLRGIRRATSKHMRESLDNAAHVTHFDEADAAAVVRLRDRWKPEAEAKGVKLTYLPIIVKAVVAALKLHPFLNSSLEDAEEEIVLKKYYNIGIAVDVPEGLIVPVVKFADQKTVLDIAAEIQGLALAARERTLDLADLKGGTFSITNVGVLGGEAATPIINYPEAAILATLKIADRVRAENGRVAIKKTLPLCLSFDHRIVDGAEAARFTNDLKKTLEDEAALERAAIPS